MDTNVYTMVPNDYCRLCKLNMREDGPSTYGHSTDMFLTKKTTSISERLALLGLTVAPESGQSNRCCSRCSSIISRLERDLPIFRQWEEEYRESSVSKRQREPTPPKTPRALKKTCPNPPSPSASAFGQTTTQVTITYPSQTLTRVCNPEEDPIIKFIVLKRWKEAASHALKHQHLQEELKHGVINLIRKECEVLCSRKNDFILWKSKPADLKSFSFKSLRDDLHRLAPFLFSIFNCISNNNNLAASTAAAIAIRGRQPRLAALSYWINTILQYGGAKKSVFNRLSQLSLTTSHKRAVKKQHELALGCGAEFVQFKGGLKATDTEATQSLEDLHRSEMLPLSSLRLLVSPLQLMAAALWGVVQHRAVMHYGLLEDFITAVLDIIPELLTRSERNQLVLGLRAQVVLEMCRSDDLCSRQNIEPHLTRIDDLVKEQDEEEASSSKLKASVDYVSKVVNTLLDDPYERNIFYEETFPSVFGFYFDSALCALVRRFLMNLEKLLPVPSLDQTSLWLGLSPPVLTECGDIFNQAEALSELIQQHKQDHDLSPGPFVNDFIFSSLSGQQNNDKETESEMTHLNGSYKEEADNPFVEEETEDDVHSVEVTLDESDTDPQDCDSSVTNVNQTPSGVVKPSGALSVVRPLVPFLN
uniref:TERF1-interacting nuclear factor 2 N-terminal domain-containing protein n=1 Tax=Neogobius melanostomus TaxID=47308 RepID=A0A8C6UX00_9GOBI